MEYLDTANQKVSLTFRAEQDIRNGQHVLALPIYQNQLVLTQHCERGIEFPGGKCEAGETSEVALRRELFEETGAQIEMAYFIAQYTVDAKPVPFTKDVYVVIVDHIEVKSDYLETKGPVFVRNIEDIPVDQRSVLLDDPAVLQCVERMTELGFY
ncbi:RNA deprotection pyrophosphohydrolase [Staphylococcus sp. 17KM0847]|uniref:RNA deprotection pyrophosphohydrolase n=1 Tax=Staphylococcus sp. 17KM0847 TaxID=2583989 RepID=UPI0015DD4B65|nr:nucleoside triphosphatase YtkD [Staphylococcus sp. 17KM0847]QLK86318.1 nucleoside triphosphatase YtkD [Staphylococcus sp. 17KM0847]